MNVTDRIEQAPAFEVINLTEAEKDLYTGSGWKLARFENGMLAGFFDPMDTPFNENTQAMVDEATDNATAWLANAKGEVWLVMCSCYQLCEPRRVALTGEYASAIPAMLNRFAEQIMEV